MSEFDYGWANSDHTTAHAYLLPHLESWIRKNKVMAIADIGAGNGSVAAAMSKYAKITCIEPSRDGVAQIKALPQELPAWDVGVYDKCPDGLTEAFDFAYSLEVIEHLQYPARLFDFARQLLRPGGQIMITTPFHGYWKNLALSLFNKWDVHANPFWDEGHIRFFSVTTITRMARENGFEVIEVHRLGRIPAIAKSMAVVCVRSHKSFATSQS